MSNLSLQSCAKWFVHHPVWDQHKLILPQGEENLGMAMTFTLVSHLREQLSQLVRSKIEEHNRQESEKERLALEVKIISLYRRRDVHKREISQEEENRTRGTPVTLKSFKAWKVKFDQEMAIKKAQEEEERLRLLTPKEREEWKRSTMRLSGAQAKIRADIWDIPYLYFRPTIV